MGRRHRGPPYYHRRPYRHRPGSVVDGFDLDRPKVYLGFRYYDVNTHRARNLKGYTVVVEGWLPADVQRIIVEAFQAEAAKNKAAAAATAGAPPAEKV